MRPYVQPLGTAHQSDSLSNTNMVVDGENTPSATGVVQIPMSGPVDKGKGREVLTGGDVEMHDVHDADEDDAVGKGERKYKNSYKHLIKGIPGLLTVFAHWLFGLGLQFVLRKTLHKKG